MEPTQTPQPTQPIPTPTQPVTPAPPQTSSTHTVQPVQAINYIPLITTPTREDRDAYRAQYGDTISWRPSTSRGLIIGGIVAFVVGVVLFQVGSASWQTSWGVAVQQLGSLTFVIGIISAILGGIVLAVQSEQTAGMRLFSFAKKNGFIYTPKATNPVHTGKIFQIGHSKVASQIVRKFDQRGNAAVEIGKYAYTVGSGKNSRTYNWVYMCLHMQRNLPHMLLDAKSNNVQAFGMELNSNIAAGIAKDQVISLEGDFDKYFTLYGPAEYQMDARYIFTPDVMATLIDGSSAFDAEIIDDKLYFYSQDRKLLSSSGDGVARRIKSFIAVLNTVLPQINEQADRYSDDRVGSRAMNAVAPQGRRLKKRSLPSIITIIIIIVWLLFSFFGSN